MVVFVKCCVQLRHFGFLVTVIIKVMVAVQIPVLVGVIMSALYFVPIELGTVLICDVGYFLLLGNPRPSNNVFI